MITGDETDMTHMQVIEGTGEELIHHLSEHPDDRFRLIMLPQNPEFTTFDQAYTMAASRTPDDIAAARARVLAASPVPRALPDGKTLADVVMGKWPGDETDEQIVSALGKLS